MRSPLQTLWLQQSLDSESGLNGMASSNLHHQRTEAATLLSSSEFPTQRNEEWKFVNLKPVLAHEYQPSKAGSDVVVPQSLLDEFKDEKNLAVLVNGSYRADLSRWSAQGLVAGSLHDLYTQERATLDQHFGTIIDATENLFVIANTACVDDGIYIRAPRSLNVDDAVSLLLINDSTNAAGSSMPRVFVACEELSSLTMLVHSRTIGEHPSLVNSVVECMVGSSARLHCTFVQDHDAHTSAINSISAKVYRDARVDFVTVSLGGALVRNNLRCILEESGSEAHMYGVYCLNDASVVDNHTVMDHRVPNCHSNELYKGILDGSSQGVFNGKIFVRKDAQKTLAYQSNRNIVLSPTASVNTKPQLEIFADDVKCSHGCTVGSIDEEALFYLRSRGIGMEQARALLLTAFAEDVTAQISHEVVREKINATIEHRLVGSAT